MTRLSLSQKDNENSSLMVDNDRIFVVEKELSICFSTVAGIVMENEQNKLYIRVDVLEIILENLIEK